MALLRPYKTRKFTLFAGESLKTTVVFVVDIKDSFTKALPLTKIFVSVEKDTNLKPLRSANGFYCFTKSEPIPGVENNNEQDETIFTVIVEPDSIKNDWYLKAEGEIDISKKEFLIPLDHKDIVQAKLKIPVLEIPLKPKPSYPFPVMATLIRG